MAGQVRDQLKEVDDSGRNRIDTGWCSAASLQSIIVPSDSNYGEDPKVDSDHDVMELEDDQMRALYNGIM
jgi:hypothetical protein